MVCETRLKPRQTIQERAEEVRRAAKALDEKIMRRLVKVRVGPQGAVTFEGWKEEDRDGVTDACAFRRLMATGSALTRMEIARAEQMAGRTIDKKVVAQGTHSHDGGETWHGKG